MLKIKLLKLYSSYLSGHALPAIILLDWKFVEELTFQIRAIDQYTCTMVDKDT